MALGVLFLVTACGADAGQGRSCTAIGTLVGVSLDVGLTTAETGTIEVCWDGRCTTPALDLFPSSRAAGGTCAGTAPTDVCGASAVPTGGKHAYVAIPDLPDRPVTVRLRLADRAGTAVVDHELSATPAMSYPNGPDCGGGGPQLVVSVGADGSVAAK
ncbi:hypothetical protein ACQPZF_09835 [Actinosynnema sp. CS-041913]|uniref:hypothetical protein n=1 Tax=Actinosynnema sp. CS-041913 TaxID=3239917 RepID=UPI003D944809